MTDEMYTTRQAALYLGVTEADVRLAVRQGKLRAWSLPLQRGLLVRKADLLEFRRGAGGRSGLTHQLPLFTADSHAARQADSQQDAANGDTSAA